LVSPGTSTVTLPALFPGKPMFPSGSYFLNVETVRVELPGLVFGTSFDQNFASNLAAIQAAKSCDASSSSLFSVGLGLERGADRHERTAGFARRFPNRYSR